MTQTLITNGDRTEIKLIVGEQLSSVTFVQDYLQLMFDGPRLTLYTWPVVTNASGQYSYGDAGYRDQLCGEIAKTVKAAYAIDQDRLQIDFDDGSTIVISLRPDDYRGPEAAMFNDDLTKTFVVW